MTDKYRYSTSQIFNFAQDSYFERTSRPIYAIVFLLPFIAVYELGTILINTDILNQSQIRVVAFIWLQQFLFYLGFGNKFAWAAPALAVMIILLGLQLASRKRWRVSISDIWPMAIECILLAIPLIVLSLFLNSSAPPNNEMARFNNDSYHAKVLAVPVYGARVDSLSSVPEDDSENHQESGQSLLANIVTGIGAGIYEELVFRLILICVLMMVFQDLCRLSRTNSAVLAVLVSAALFSAHHHIIFLNGQFGQASQFDWTEFIFRTLAGVYFAVLFAIRGFGITAGTHAFYDIIATAMNAFFFQH